MEETQRAWKDYFFQSWQLKSRNSLPVWAAETCTDRCSSSARFVLGWRQEGTDRKFLCRRGKRLEIAGKSWKAQGCLRAPHFESQMLRNSKIRLIILGQLIPVRKRIRNSKVRLIILGHLVPGGKRVQKLRTEVDYFGTPSTSEEKGQKLKNKVDYLVAPSPREEKATQGLFSSPGSRRTQMPEGAV